MKVFSNLFIHVLLSVAFAAHAEVPAAGQASDKVYNYHRYSPDIAMSGRLEAGALDELKSLGFITIIDVRTAAEGVAGEAEEAAALGLDHINIPVGRELPGQQAIAQFRQLVDADENKPLLIHCASSNRVGLMWGIYQVDKGADLEAALQEGRDTGMKASSEPLLRQYFDAKAGNE